MNKIIILLLFLLTLQTQVLAEEAQVLQKVRLQLNWKHQFQFAGYYAAIEQGFYARRGLELEIIEYTDAINVIEEVVSGRADYGSFNIQLISKRLQGAPIILLGNYFKRYPLVFITQKGISTIEELKGKRLMTTRKDFNSALIRHVFKSAELIPGKNITLVPHTFTIKPFVDNEIDAMTAYLSNEPFQLDEQGKAYQIIDFSSLFPTLGEEFLFTSEQKTQINPRQADDFLAASNEGWQYALSHQDEIIALILKKYSTKKSVAALKFEAERVKALIMPKAFPIGSISIDRLRPLAKVLLEMGDVQTLERLNNFIFDPLSDIIFSKEEQQWLKQHPQLTIGAISTRAPFEFIDKQGQYLGIASEYIKIIAEKTGLEFIIEPNLTRQGAMEGIKSGQFDLLPAMGHYNQGKKLLDYSTPYTSYPMVIAVKKGNDYMSYLEELENKQVAIVEGCIGEEILRHNYPDLKLKLAKNIQQALLWVSSGEVDALVSSLIAITYNTTQLGITNLRISGITPYSFDLSIATSRQHKILQGIIQKVLAGISKEQHQKIRQKWVTVPYKQKVNYKKFFIISFAVLVVIVLILLWVWQLSKQIHARELAEQALLKNQKTLEYKNHILELLSKGASLQIILATLLQYLEQAQPEMLGSILLLDKQGKRLINGISISLPEYYMQAINGMEIGQGAGSCGTAAYTAKVVIVADIMSHPYWDKFKHLAQAANLRACWSLPIMSANNQVLGTFAIYHHQPHRPSKDKIHFIQEFTLLSALVIEHCYTNREFSKFKEAVEQSPASIIITDLAGNIEYTNPCFSKITGYSAKEVLGKNPRILNSGQTCKGTYTDLWNTLLQGKVWYGEFVNRHKNGTHYWEHAVITPIRDEQGKIINYVSIKEDITRYKRIEEQNTRLGRIMENSLNEIYLFDAHTLLFSQVNKGARQNIGYTMQELRKLTPANIGLSYLREAIEKRLEPLRSGKRDFLVIKAQHQRKDGSFYPVEVHMQFFQAEVNSVFVAIVQDISERTRGEILLQQARIDAEKASQAKSQFIANMSHELRTPLNAILGFSQMIVSDENLTAKQREELAIINSSGTHLLNLINDILDMSKIESGEIELYPASFNLYHLLETLNDFFQVSLNKKSLQLYCFYAPDCPQSIYADKTKLRQILLNLIDNAIKFTDKGGVIIRVRHQKMPDNKIRLYFTVEDTGYGITEQELEAIFQSFTQSESGLKSQKGTGLGLSITQQFVHLMGGNISVESQLNKGSVFKFNILLNENKETGSIQENTGKVIGLAPGQMTYRILVVDDNKVNRFLLLKLLSIVGFELKEAENGRQAIELYKDWQPHCILMDMRMPVMDGYEATKKIKALSKQALIIAVTASVFADKKEAIKEVGCDDYITKPFKVTEIYAVLQKYLGISYVYRQEPKVVTKISTDNNLIKTSFVQLPTELQEKLKQALTIVDIKEIDSLLAQIYQQDTQLSMAIKQRVDNFDYERLLVLLE